jgi:Flp pilus assembly protein TadG
MSRSSRNLAAVDRRRVGQSLVELALAVPVMFLLLMGGFDASILVSDKVTSASAVRQGARLAAELGGLQTNPGATTTSVDMQVVRSVLAITHGMSMMTITEIDIYAPHSRNGSYDAANDPGNEYFISASGSVSVGRQTFPISARRQTPPNETSIGVRLVWAYHAPGGIFPRNLQLTDYAVMKAAPVLT